MYIYTSEKRPFENVRARNWAEAINKLRDLGLVQGRLIKTEEEGNLRRYSAGGEAFELRVLMEA